MGNGVFGPPPSTHEHATIIAERIIARQINNHVDTEGSSGASIPREEDPLGSESEDLNNNNRDTGTLVAAPQLADATSPNSLCSGPLTKMSSGSMAASAASLASSPTGGSSSAHKSWCLVKAKTRQHNSTRVARKLMWFEAKPNSSFRIGRAQHCELRLDDDRCSDLNATLEPSEALANGSPSRAGNGAPGILLTPRARMYQLVGMGAKRSPLDTVIEVGAVLKVGSVSLEVTDMCTEESDDFVERFAVEISSARRSASRRSIDRLRARGDTHVAAAAAASAASNGGASAVVTGAKKAAMEKRGTAPATGKAAAAAAAAAAAPTAGTKRGPNGGSGPAGSGSGSSNHEGESDGSVEEGGVSQTDNDDNRARRRNEKKNDDDDDDDEEPLGEDASDNESVAEEGDEEDDDAMCYICWGGQEGGEDDDEPPVQGKDMTSAAAALARQQLTQGPRGARTSAVLRENPLITNPCGKCSGSSRYVHLNCLLKWIKSSGSGHCSICNGPLPQHFSSPPPNIELKVVRHRRGQSWIGTRRFRLSFAERDVALIGRDSESDVRLPDRSVGSTHARITFNRATRQFELADCQSLGGTFLQVKGPLELVPEQSVYLKIGRTLLSLRMTHKRSALSLLPNPLAWTKR